MIISHKHKFIFIKTAKTAGTTVEIALSKICGSEDIITPISPQDEEVRKKLGHTGPQNYMGPLHTISFRDWFLFKFKRKQSYRFFNHAKANQVRRWIGPDIWDSYFKFSVDRHPIDKYVSFYFWRGGDEKWGSFDKFMKSGKSRRIHGMKYYGIDGEIVVDKIYQKENLPGMMEDLSKRLNLEEPLTLPSHKAKSNTSRKNRHYSEVLSEEQINKIREEFKWEFEYFDYE